VANYFRVSPKFWLKARERGWSDAQTTLALYLLTCEHRKLEGLYRLPKAYIADDLTWSAEKVNETLAAVCESGFAQYDEQASIVLIPKALKHQSPSTENHLTGAINQLERLPRTCLWDAFRMACASHCPKLADRINMRWPSDGDATYAHARGVSSSSNSPSISLSPSIAQEEEGEDLSVPLAAVMAVFAESPPVYATEAGIENAIRAYPDADHVMAAREVRSWVTNGKDMKIRNPGSALMTALGKQKAPAPTPSWSKPAAAKDEDTDRFSKYDKAVKRTEAA
jgi:hypothetical protein